MDFALTSEQQALADSIERFRARDYTFGQRNKLMESKEGWSRDHWQTFAELGWLGAGLSEESGGFGGGPVETMILMEGFGRALLLEPFLATAVLALQTLAALPANESRNALIEQIIAGETLVTIAHGEEAGRGDVGFVEARLKDGKLFGSKSLVLGAPSADRLIVSALVEDSVELFLVDPGTQGVCITRYRLLDNVRAGDLELDGVLPIEQLSSPGSGRRAIDIGHAHALVGVCAEAVGAMDSAILMTRDYLKTRQQFGTTLNNFQALQHRMADMLIEMEMSRSILYQGAAALLRGDDPSRHDLSAMKAIVSSACMFVGRNAVQLHGGIGMTEEYAIGHYYRKMFVIASLFGGESHHLAQIAGLPQPFWSDDLAPQDSSMPA